MEDIPIAQRTTLRCDAKINNTIPCPNPAMAGSIYCWAHRIRKRPSPRQRRRRSVAG
ncbi:MAG: hypothetical protein R3C44_00205 [Chloroflexota bacterium]